MVPFLSTSLFLPQACAQMNLSLPALGSRIAVSSHFEAPFLKGITIDPQNPFHFHFIVDPGHSGLKGDDLREESTKLIKYFLATLTIPQKDVWVNLSPEEPDRITSQAFGETEMGRDLLAQDYLLKQITASLIYPENDLGRKFWDKVYKKAAKTLGTTNIPVDVFNKVWIVPDSAAVYEHGNTTIVIESRLKVLLEKDYLAKENNTKNDSLNATSEILREIILPAIEEEVNHGKNFTPLRQIYHSAILAKWYKQKLQESLLNQVYSDKNKTLGIDVNDKKIKEKIYQQYLEAFKRGAYNYIREEYDPTTQQMIPRKYFSGGANVVPMDVPVRPQASDKQTQPTSEDGFANVEADVTPPGKNINRGPDEALLIDGDDKLPQRLETLHFYPQITFDYGLGEIQENFHVEHQYMAYRLEQDRRNMSVGGRESTDEKLRQAVRSLAEQTGILSQGVLETLETYDRIHLRFVYSYLAEMVVASLLKNGHRDPYDYLRRNLRVDALNITHISKLDQASRQDRFSYFVNEFGWRLIFVATRPILVTTLEAYQYGTSQDSEENRLTRLLPKALNLSNPRTLREAAAEILAPVSSDQILMPLAEPQNRIRDLAVIRNEQDTFPIAVPTGIKGVIAQVRTPPEKKLRPILVHAVTEKVRVLTNEGRFAEAARLYETNLTRAQAQASLVELLRTHYRQPSVMEFLSHLDYQLVGDSFIHAFSRGSEDGISAEDHVVRPLIYWLYLIRKYELADYQGIPIPVFILARMEEVREYQPILAKIRELVEEDRLMGGQRPAVAGIREVAKLLEVLDEHTEGGRSLDGRRYAFVEVIDEAKVLTVKLEE
ncbi:MAG: hypothetical protein NUV91_04510, partial [Candidatus Omnitrophica bacterium]|nr:hypothetical protein [Candidatus Omnitrophota bacterium]